MRISRPGRAVLVVRIGGAVLASLVFPAAALGAATHTLSGRLLGVPRGASTTIEAVAVRGDGIVAAQILRGTTYSVRVPAGPTFLLARVVDIRRHRQLDAYTALTVTRSLRGIDLRLRLAAAADSATARLAAAAGSAAGSSVSVGTIPIVGPDGTLPGGAEAGFIAGALPVCQAHGGKLLDKSNVFTHARLTEVALAQAGQLDFNLLPWQLPVSDYGVGGFVRVGPNGGPLADIYFVNNLTDQVVHFVVAGDPEDWDDIGRFMARLGDHIIQNQVDQRLACDEDEVQSTQPPPAPKLHCDAGKGEVCVTFSATAEGSESTASNVATGRSDTVSWDIKWSIPADGNGESGPPDRGSYADGHGHVDYQPDPPSPPPSCDTDFELSKSEDPMVTETSRHGELTVQVPNPAEESIGSGGGFPSIVPTKSQCPALIGALPGSFQITVPIRHETTTHPADGGGPFTVPGGSGEDTMKGTITIQVG
jgi:hypothetical protein